MTQSTSQRAGFGVVGLLVGMAILLVCVFIAVKSLSSRSKLPAEAVVPAEVQAEMAPGADTPAGLVNAVKGSTDRMAEEREKKLACQADPEAEGCAK